MFIKKISINNFRIYKDINTIEFHKNPNRNIFIVAGNNGFGKTSFLTSLVWCLYGKKMSEVEEAYRKDILTAGGYRNYLENNLNKSAYQEGIFNYYIEITLNNISIPFLPSEEILIRREYDIKNEKEKVTIIIDGLENELTKEVGPDIFINDFVLPKEIAKFFFFDSEKIVNLAESKTIEEVRSISKAYSEVLGIKKYEDLKNNLKDLRLRFRKESAGTRDKIKFDELNKEYDKIREIIKIHNEKVELLKEEKEIKKLKSNQIQERLIREGQALSLAELTELRKDNLKLIEKNQSIKKQLNELIDLIPFALVTDKLEEIGAQLEKESCLNAIDNLDGASLMSLIGKAFKDKRFKQYLNKAVKKNELNTFKNIFEETIISKLNKNYGISENTKVLHSFSKEEVNEFNSILFSVKGFFKEKFSQISYEYKQNQIELRKISRKLSDAEKKEDDLLISTYRTEKETLEKEISDIENQIITHLSTNETLEREASNKMKQISEIGKLISLDSDNILKDEIAEKIINKIDQFITKFKEEKKKFLEEKILISLNALMHKKGFITRVKVDINTDLVEINLFNKYGNIIDKNELSKGEQQLYATAVLKALVEESNIKFPVFIDSPLQKFDIKHSRNVIVNFYPNISDQVVICPLLEKELTEKEYEYLIKNVEDVYIISNISDTESIFKKVEPKTLFETFKELMPDVF